MVKNNLKECALTQAVVRVGYGRGFVVEHHHNRVVITASHCLPTDSAGRLILPPSHPGRYLEEGTYQKLLGPLGGEPTVWAECLFADPIADIAVLGSPDNQTLSEQADAYEELVGNAVALKVVDAPKMVRKRTRARVVMGHRIPPVTYDDAGGCRARVLSLKGEWLKCMMKRYHRGLVVADEGLFEGGMSGSPILSLKGGAMGLISTDRQSPVLTYCLPAWFFKSARPAPPAC
jgi:hypothetical protein